MVEHIDHGMLARYVVRISNSSWFVPLSRDRNEFLVDAAFGLCGVDVLEVQMPMRNKLDQRLYIYEHCITETGIPHTTSGETF